MIVFAPAKINIGLYITSKRDDGFHNIETVFYPLPFFDVIEIVESDRFSLTEYGISSGCGQYSNLCYKAWELLMNDFHIPPVSISLLKNIPVKAGLGGGSSNAVAVMKELNSMFQLKISEEALHNYALLLGSDCPFFVNAVPSYGTSRGEKLSEINLSLKGKTIFIFKPEQGMSTKEAFEHVEVKEHNKLLEHIREPVSQWKSEIRNMFEPFFFSKYPEMKACCDMLYESGAEYVSMTGSGSAFYAVYDSPNPEIPELPEGFFVRMFGME